MAFFIFSLTHRSKVSHGCFTGFKQEKEVIPFMTYPWVIHVEDKCKKVCIMAATVNNYFLSLNI